jgi:hypothetical protein
VNVFFAKDLAPGEHSGAIMRAKSEQFRRGVGRPCQHKDKSPEASSPATSTFQFRATRGKHRNCRQDQKNACERKYVSAQGLQRVFSIEVQG